MDIVAIWLENASDSSVSQNGYNSRSHNFSNITFGHFNRFLPIDSKFCNFQGHKWADCPKNWIQDLDFSKKKSNFITLSFEVFLLSKTMLKKNLSNERMMKFQFFCFEQFKFWIQFFGQSGHFWTWKMQNLDSMHQNE